VILEFLKYFVSYEKNCSELNKYEIIDHEIEKMNIDMDMNGYEWRGNK